MKKLVLSLFATLLFGFAGNAQTKLSAREKSVVDAQMVTLANLATATVYQKGMSQNEFMKLAGPESPTKDEVLLLQKMYNYAASGATDCEIMKGDNSVLLTISQTHQVSPTSPANKWPWKEILEILIKVLTDILPYVIP